MRKLTAGLFHSVDGVVEGPDKWQFDAFDNELGAALGKVIGNVDTVILGRVGYQEWSSYWPNAEVYMDFGRFINRVPKFVASRTLKGPLAWQNATLISGDVVSFVRDLKGKPGGEISVMGGISLVRHLFLGGLLDELTLITHPVIAGKGRRMFEAGDPVTRLELKQEYRTSKGNVVTTYALRR